MRAGCGRELDGARARGVALGLAPPGHRVVVAPVDQSSHPAWSERPTLQHSTPTWIRSPDTAGPPPSPALRYESIAGPHGPTVFAFVAIQKLGVRSPGGGSS